MADKKKYYLISSLQKGIHVLELLARHKALTVSEVATHLASNRAASHRFLATLRDLGYVEKNEEGRYQLTFRMLEMGMQVTDRFEIRQTARKYMQELATAFKETVNLGVWDGSGILHVDKIDSPEILRIDAPVGSKAPAYCTALGKAVLAHLPADELDAYLSRTRLSAHGPHTIVAKKELREELRKTSARGYAVDNEELASGLRCVAAPVFDHSGHVRYALSISCPSMRLKMKDVKKVAAAVKAACQDLSARLGFHPDESAVG